MYIFQKVGCLQVGNMKKDGKRTGFKNLSDEIIAAFDGGIKSSHMSTDCKNFIAFELHEVLENDDGFFAVTARELFRNFIERFFNPLSVFFDVTGAGFIEIHFAEIVKQGYDSDGFS